jgi:enoyl-CoA hydratase/carnithine racemase
MKHIRVEREGGVGVLTIARRERLNSLDVETAQDFRRAGL